VGTGIDVNASGYTLGGADAGNYVLDQDAVASADITVKTLTISGLSADDKEYDGGTSVNVTGTGALVGVIDPDTVTWAGRRHIVLRTRTWAPVSM
jgi:hypothetical protein